MQTKKTNIFSFLPFAIFLGLVAMFAFGMWGNRVSKDASPLIGKPLPQIISPTLDNKEIDLAQYAGKPLILNFFASWCAPCKEEHPNLGLIAQNQDVVLLGFAYRDDPAKTRDYIAEMGNPYAQIAVDRQGAAGALLGLTGVPETYIVNKDGIIIYKHKGEITPADVPKILKMAIEGKQ